MQEYEINAMEIKGILMIGDLRGIFVDWGFFTDYGSGDQRGVWMILVCGICSEFLLIIDLRI